VVDPRARRVEISERVFHMVAGRRAGVKVRGSVAKVRGACTIGRMRDNIGGNLRSGSGPGVMKSFRRDASVTTTPLSPGIYRRIAGFARPYRRQLVAFLGLIGFDALVNAANPLVYRAIIDDGALARRPDVVIGLAFVLVVLGVADMLDSLAQRWISARIGEGLIYDLRTSVFNHVQRMPIAFFTRTQTGAMLSRLNNDVLDAQQAFTGTLSSVVGNVVGVVITIAAMAYLSWQITLVALVVLPIIVLPTRWLGRRVNAITRESYQLSAEMTSTMAERFNVAGALLVKLFGDPERERSGFADAAGRVRDIGVTRAMFARLFRVAILLAAALATALVYGWGGVLAADGTLAVGTLVALAAYLNRLYAPLTALSNVQVDVMTALVSFDRLFEVLDLRPMVVDKPDAVDIPPGPATIEVEDVTFWYPAAEEVSIASLEGAAAGEPDLLEPVLEHVSFAVQPGQLVALVGPSGAGKTTLGHLVGRLYDVRGGAIRINGVDLRNARLDSIAHTVSIVTQDSHLFHNTIRANLLYARPDASEAELREALAAARILPLVDTLSNGIDTLVGDRGYRLSGGEKQRIAIARLLLRAPQVVVLDEATAHLDAESELAVQLALKTALQGRTSIVIAHRLSTVRQADAILVLQSGRIVERGAHADLIAANGLYSVLYRTQFDVPVAERTTA
jgi:ATP-binding cassette, subfamily B, bacterial